MLRLLLAFISMASLAGGVWAADPAVNPYRSALTGISPIELPAKAAELVSKVTGPNLKAIVAVEVVKAAVEVNPNTAMAVVSSVSRAAPDSAPSVAAAAASKQPKLAPAIAKAAAAAAPAQAGKIVFAVCQALPYQFRGVAIAVAQAVPAAALEILRGVVSAIPPLGPFVDHAKAAVVASGSEVTVEKVLTQTDRLMAAASGPQLAPLERFNAAQSPSVIGPPYRPTNTVPAEISTGTSGELRPGGRDYSSP